jgi:hypothetical protein
MPLSDTDRGISPLTTSIAAVLWSILPLYLFIRRTERMLP